ncbi:MAG: hypothetical protein JRD89_17125 [Deltaproteobacteria bacterium]|nr:hypothetical protein [Deltaproteobacteria bacterium]
MSKDPNKKTIKIKTREGTAFGKLVTQAFFWVSLASMYWANHAYLDDSIPSWVLFTMFILGWAALAMSVVKPDGEFTDAAKAKAFIDDFYSSE